jgi:hypothetical protein
LRTRTTCERTGPPIPYERAEEDERAPRAGVDGERSGDSVERSLHARNPPAVVERDDRARPSILELRGLGERQPAALVVDRGDVLLEHLVPDHPVEPGRPEDMPGVVERKDREALVDEDDRAELHPADCATAGTHDLLADAAPRPRVLDGEAEPARDLGTKDVACARVENHLERPFSVDPHLDEDAVVDELERDGRRDRGVRSRRRAAAERDYHREDIQHANHRTPCHRLSR